MPPITPTHWPSSATVATAPIVVAAARDQHALPNTPGVAPHYGWHLGWTAPFAHPCYAMGGVNNTVRFFKEKESWGQECYLEERQVESIQPMRKNWTFTLQLLYRLLQPSWVNVSSCVLIAVLSPSHICGWCMYEMPLASWGIWMATVR